MSEKSAYEKLVDFKEGLARRAQLLRGRLAEVVAELAAREGSLDEAILAGNQKEEQERIVALKTERDDIQRQLQALEHPPQGGIMKQLVEEAWREATDEVTVTLREQFNEELRDLEMSKSMFLAAVAELGAIKRKADRISSRITELLLDVPGPKRPVPSLSTGITIRKNPDRKQGPIFLDPEEVARTFSGGH